MGRKNDPEWLSPSELGSYVYCAKSFEHKVRGTRIGGTGRKRLQKGTAMHHRHGVTYDWQIRLRKLALRLLGAALVAGAAYAVYATGVL